jgi:hypothetical protein
MEANNINVYAKKWFVCPLDKLRHEIRTAEGKVIGTCTNIESAENLVKEHNQNFKFLDKYAIIKDIQDIILENYYPQDRELDCDEIANTIYKKYIQPQQ